MLAPSPRALLTSRALLTGPAVFTSPVPTCQQWTDAAQKWLFVDGCARPLLCSHCGEYSSSRKWQCTCHKPCLLCQNHCLDGMLCRGKPRLKRPRTSNASETPAWLPKRQRCRWALLKRRLHGMQIQRRSNGNSPSSPSMHIKDMSNQQPPKRSRAQAKPGGTREMYEKRWGSYISGSLHNTIQAACVNPSSSHKRKREPSMLNHRPTAARRGVLVPLGPKLASRFLT